MLCTGNFIGAFNTLLMVPLLPLVVLDLGVSISDGGLLLTAPTLVGALAGLWAGPAMDRRGRRPLVVAGLLLVGVCNLAMAIAPSFWVAVALRAGTGLGMTALFPATLSAAGEYFSYRERGKAMGLAITAGSSAPLLGVPIGSVIAGLTSWRLALLLVGALAIGLGVLLYAKLPHDRPTGEAARAALGVRASLRTVMQHPAVAMSIVSMFFQAGYWFVMVTYIGALFFQRYDVPAWALGGLNSLMALGIMVGANGGGRLGDRLGKRRTAIVSTACCAVFGTLITTAAPVVWLALLYVILYAIPNGARVATAQAVLSELVPGLRGTLSTFGAAGQSLGASMGSFLGSVVVGTVGFDGLGPTVGVLALISTLIFWRWVHEAPPPTEPAAAAAG